MNSLVSIIIPCYNSEKWIERALVTALSQTYDNIEVIFVDNESTDNSVSIAEKVKESFPQLILSSAKNIYPHCWDEPRSRGFELMKGDYVLVMGSDDFLREDFIENNMKFFKTRPGEILALQSPIMGIHSDTGKTAGIISHSYKSLEEFKQKCLNSCPVNTPTVMYNTSLFKSGLLKTRPEQYGGAADYDLYCQLADNEIFIYPAPFWLGFYYRWHEDQATWKVQKEKVNYDALIQKYWRDRWKI
jgi:glycosyltransferase involved in cell wall biosynthesis